MLYVTTYATGVRSMSPAFFGGGITNKRQQEHMLGRTLLNVGLQREYALFLPALSLKNGEYGKPYLEERPDIHFSISHCDGLVACGLHDRTIGVDVEQIRPFSERLLRKVLSEEELGYFLEQTAGARKNNSIQSECGSTEEICTQEICVQERREQELFFRYWTLKESYLKAIGIGLSAPMKDFSFILEPGEADGEVLFPAFDGGKILIHSFGRIKAAGVQPGYEFYQARLWGTHLMAVCVSSDMQSIQK